MTWALPCYLNCSMESAVENCQISVLKCSILPACGLVLLRICKPIPVLRLSRDVTDKVTQATPLHGRKGNSCNYCHGSFANIAICYHNGNFCYGQDCMDASTYSLTTTTASAARSSSFARCGSIDAIYSERPGLASEMVSFPILLLAG